MAQSVVRRASQPCIQPGKEALVFLWKKLKGIYPTYFFSLALELLVANFVGITDKTPFSEMIHYVWDILFLRITGLRGITTDMAVGGTWYLSAMILAMWMMYPLLRQKTDLFLHVIAPLFSVFSMGWFINTYGTMKFQLDFTENGLPLGFVRALTELSLGCVSFAICQWLQEYVSPTGRTRFLITVGEFGALGMVFVMIAFAHRADIEFLCVFLMVTGIALSFTGMSYSGKLFRNWTLSWAGKFSLGIYLTHVTWVRMLMRWKLPVSYNLQILLTFILTILSTLLCMHTIDLISAIAKRYSYAVQKRID